MTTSIEWQAVYDVVVLGFGGAGATAARFAADKGKKVLLVDAAPFGHEGGNTRYAGQGVNATDDYDKMMQYYNEITYPMSLPEDVKKVYVQGLVDNKTYFKKYLGVSPVSTHDLGRPDLAKQAIEYPKFDGSEANDALTVHKGAFDAALWKNLRQQIIDRADQVDVWLESRARKLIQNSNNVIVGVQIERHNQTVSVAAKHGVVLAMGGFENNQEMIQSYLGEPKLSPMGSLYNRGDGIAMAQKAGAKMWHMSNYESYSLMHGLYFDVPGAKRSREVYWEAGENDGGVVVVGDDGTRYFNEAEHARHGHIYSHGTWKHAPLSVKPYMIFDQTQCNEFQKHPFEYVNLNQLIVKADNLSELAKKISIPADKLEQTIDTYNKFNEIGTDYQFGRNIKTMRKFDEGPYYAVRMVNTILNTQGGPQRNGKAQIIGQDGKPIPHLFGAGELGGITANLYQGAGNLAECLIFGKIAGESVSKTDALSIQVANDKYQKINDLISGEQIGSVELADNQYLGESNSGIGGKLVVRVTYDDDTIKNIEILQEHESEDVGQVALKTMPEQMVANNDIDVDATSGASATSRALKSAVRDAIDKAKAANNSVSQ
ncbi:FAD-binding protein [Secundilactobacillus mixtipabuli]|uniref:Urocanate reductase n=1 Tax=Secundilactobacillus mixtipabuli TaxID=1435342 RepID=A0A1Z5I9L9_9LACO|nr:FAD-binding protein [Secundilactobacillus mixtipabuli]GAW98496.1 fumarate reductase flavoprotein subunit [Secundilactobacillus mixtipabuli]